MGFEILASRRIIALGILAVILSISSAYTRINNSPALVPSPVTSASPPPTAVISVAPENITKGNVGSFVTFSLTLASSPSITYFGVWLQFNTSILQADPGNSSTISYSGNILGSNTKQTTPTVSVECIGSSTIVGHCESSQENLFVPDVVSLNMYLLGGANTTISGGLLFRTTFKVLGTGFSQLHILYYVLGSGVTDQAYGANTIDGFFTNRICGLAVCKPPFVDFTISPSQPSIGTVVLLNATASHATNQDPTTHKNVGIENYHWFWGGEICHGIGSDQIIFNNPTITHVFCNAQTYLLGLAVTDIYGVSWLVTKSLNVIFVFYDVRVNGAYVDHQFNVIPGTIVHINGGIYNNSTVAAFGSLTIILDNRTLLYTQKFNLTQRGSSNASATTPTIPWNTTGWPVKAWRIDFMVTAFVHQNVTNDKLASKYVQLVVPQPLGLLSLNLLQSAGLGIIVILALGAGIARFRRRPSWETEPVA